MYEGVEESNEEQKMGWEVLQHSPSADGHDGVMVKMEEADLVVLLAENEEYCVE